MSLRSTLIRVLNKSRANCTPVLILSGLFIMIHRWKYIKTQVFSGMKRCWQIFTDMQMKTVQLFLMSRMRLIIQVLDKWSFKSILDFIGVSEFFIKFDSTVANTCGKICCPRLKTCETNPDQQLLFFYQSHFSPCIFVKVNQVTMFQLEKHLNQLDMFRVYITQSSLARVKIQECYIQCFYDVTSE